MITAMIEKHDLMCNPDRAAEREAEIRKAFVPKRMSLWQAGDIEFLLGQIDELRRAIRCAADRAIPSIDIAAWLASRQHDFIGAMYRREP